MLPFTSGCSRASTKRSGWMPIGKAATRVSQPLSSTPSGVPCRANLSVHFKTLPDTCCKIYLPHTKTLSHEL